MEYRIRFDQGNIEVVDSSNQPVETEAVHMIIRRLRRAYPMKCFVYVGHSPTTGLWKIGMSRNVARRAEQLGIVIKHTLAYGSVRDAADTELLLHAWAEDHRAYGEWYSFDDDSDIENLLQFGDDRNASLYISTFGYANLLIADRLPQRLKDKAEATWEEAIEWIHEVRKLARKRAREAKKQNLMEAIE